MKNGGEQYRCLNGRLEKMKTSLPTINVIRRIINASKILEIVAPNP